MMLHLILALQSISGPDIPPDFDLRKVNPSPDANAIVVTARRQSQRIEREPASDEPPLGRAEIGLFGEAKANLHVENHELGAAGSSQRVMVGVKIPF
jgi:hypothetical protein